MNGLIELVFEKVPDGAVNGLVSALLQEAHITEVSHSELGDREPKEVGGNYLQLLKTTTDPASIFVKAAETCIGRVPIYRPLVRILRCCESNEVTVVFDSQDVVTTDRQDAVFRMAAGARALAESSDVAEFYCGYEPATDERTRLFCRGKVGPLTVI
jgi:hypothetical protein